MEILIFVLVLLVGGTMALLLQLLRTFKEIEKRIAKLK
jgi:hypothetical protein